MHWHHDVVAIVKISYSTNVNMNINIIIYEYVISLSGRSNKPDLQIKKLNAIIKFQSLNFTVGKSTKQYHVRYSCSQ